MSFDRLLIHTLAVERATSGAPGPYGQPSRTFTTLATFRGRLEPKSAREVAALHGAGAVVSDHTLRTRPRDLRESDRIRFEPDDGRRFEVTGVRLIGARHHLTIDLTLLEAGT